MPLARTTDPVTSHEAGASVKNITATQQAILDIFTSHSIALTDESLVSIYKRGTAHGLPYASESGIRSRRAELVKLGKLCDTGLRIKLYSGRNAILWGLAK